MKDTDTAQKKQMLRKTIREKARSLDPAYCASADERICRHLLSMPEYRNASRIFCFISLPHEADTRIVIRDALASGKTVAVPRCEKSGVMHAFEISDPDTDLTSGMFGIPEPSAELPQADPASFDLILVPCCTCSHDGRRLGFGGGYYDRYLEKTDSLTIALCREMLICDDIPTDPYDKQMDIVLTDAGIFRSL